jgi:ribosome-associated protein
MCKDEFLEGGSKIKDETLTESKLDKAIKDLTELIDSKKGENITIMDVESITAIAKYIVIVTANSLVHSNSLTKHIIDFFDSNGLSDYLVSRRTGNNNPWVLIDASGIVVHVFLPETREFYNLEKLYFKGRLVNY